ncbi:hypothetical protein HPB52_007832 [Rhipicephalus sanguineus]|uniref:ABC transporter n=1 Tax=Rhipicephalus sanguineus TaxID=34632 RepID=A0A9D4QBD5_RHISA|nr:hypothetical protein HPB52_007832 [Rhipicephalus sanguineus]
MTVRDNILFGKALDVARYTRVLDACELLHDVERFPAGDLTEVGEKGATLSGGQKQRISLARAVYSDSSVYLLDDPLSGLDVHVAAKVFKRVIGNNGLLRNKTRIVVSNHSRFLEQMDRILLVINKQVASFENFDDLKSDPRCPITLHQDDKESKAEESGPQSRLHKAMIRSVLRCPVHFFDATPRGRVLNRFSADIDNIETRFYLAAKQVLETIALGVARIVVTGLQSPAAGLVGGSVTAIFLFLVAVVAKASNAARRLESVEFSRLLQHVAETRELLSVVRSYGVTDCFCEHYYGIVDVALRPLLALFGCLRSVRFLGGLCGFLVILASVVFGVLALGTSRDVATDETTMGLALSSSMAIPLLIIGATASVFVFTQTFVCFERCLEYTRLTPEENEDFYDVFCETNHSYKTRRGLLSSYEMMPAIASWTPGGRVEFNHYTASYRPGIMPDALADICFVVEPREKAIGRTGAGKSSLFMAILRVLEATHGYVCIDGVSITSVPLQKLRSVVTLIPQASNVQLVLMRGTLRDALDPTGSHSDQEVWLALHRVHLAEFVSSHPDNIMMHVGDGGSNLSAGERQLLCLARALLRRPRLLLMDEATSHMDGDTERLVRSTLRESFDNCTVLTIAHRLETVLEYDKILVMENGRVVEFGPTELLSSNHESAFYKMLRHAGVTLRRSESCE